MWRCRLQALLILGVTATSSSFVTVPTRHVRVIHSQAFTARRTSSQLFIFESIMDALTGRSDTNRNNNNNNKRRNTYYDDVEPIKRYRGESGLGGTSSPYYGPMPYGYAKGNTGISVSTSNYVPGGDMYYPRQERMNDEFAAYSRTDGTTILPQQLTSSTVSGTSSFSSSLGIPATARGFENFPNNSNRSTRSSFPISTATTTRQPRADEEPQTFVPGGEAYYRQTTDEEKKRRTTATSSSARRVNGDFSDHFTGINYDTSSSMAGTKDQMAIQLKQALNQVKSLEEDNKMLVRELRVARGVEEDLVKAQERLELEVASLQKQMIQLQNRCKTTDYERQDLTQKLNLYVQERDATRVNYEDNLDINNRLAQAERRLRLTGIYINEDN